MNHIQAKPTVWATSAWAVFLYLNELCLAVKIAERLSITTARDTVKAKSRAQ